MEALLLALLSIATSIALDRTIDRIHGHMNNNNSISPDDIIGTVNSMINEAKTKGENVLMKLNSKLGAINYPFGMSSSVKDFISNKRNEISKITEKATKDYSSIEKSLNNVQDRAYNLANQSEDYRKTFGKEKSQKIYDDTRDIMKQVNNLEREVETNV